MVALSNTARSGTAGMRFNDEVLDVLLGRVRELLPMFARNAFKADQDRRLPDENMRSLREAGLVAALLPKRLGGFGISWSGFCRINAEIARVCPSTAWVYAIMGAAAFLSSQAPRRVRAETFANGPPMMCGAIAPGGSIEKVDGGYRLNGKWPWATGCYWADWVGGAALLKEADGTLSPGWMWAAPRSTVTIEDTWFTTGMRGTGSATLVAENVFVPEQLITPPGFIPGSEPDRGAPSEPSSGYEFIPMVVTSKAVIAIAACRMMLDQVLESAPRRKITYSVYNSIAESQVAQAELGKAAAQLDASEVLLERTLSELDRAAAAGERVTPPARAHMRGGAAMVNQLVREAADSLLTVYGTSAFSLPQPMERLWRDINVVTRHAFVNSNICFEAYGRALLGIKESSFLSYFL
jgi:3-hydroxy-9,10-secoandrosta-1,3,5(10)-triene-9,17-dione monooxygenase